MTFEATEKSFFARGPFLFSPGLKQTIETAMVSRLNPTHTAGVNFHAVRPAKPREAPAAAERNPIIIGTRGGRTRG